MRRPSWEGMPRRAWSARSRILASYLLLLAFSTIASVLVIRQVMLDRLDANIEKTLVQETEEFRRLVGGRDPRTGRPFGGDVPAIFDTYLSRNVPDDDEVLLTFIDGRVDRVSPRAKTDVAPAVERELALPERWPALTTARRGELETSRGQARYALVPMLAGGRPSGAFVVVELLRDERREVQGAIRVAGGVSIAVHLLAALLAFAAAGRVMSPLRDLRDTARSITESDLSGRIEVRGRDEIASLSLTFNEMLDRLQASFDAQREFVNDAGHDLRTPITIIRGHLDVMGDDPRDRAEALEVVHDELDRMERYVEDLLLLAKAERPDFLRLERFELGQLAHELLAKSSALADRDWRLELRSDGTVVGDRQRLTQAVLNLARNAAQHTGPDGTIALAVSHEGASARITVRDSGEGVPLPDRERIFGRFERAGDSRDRADGAGLGLAIVQAIAESHGGRIELQSAPGEGAAFTIVIPTGSRAADLPPATPQEVPAR